MENMHLKKIQLLVDQYPTREYYPFNLEVLRQTAFLEFQTPVSLLVGENGSGKSTLLEALAHVCGIHIWREPAFSRKQSSPFEDQLYRYIQPEWSNGRVAGSYFGSAFFQDFARMVDEWAFSDPGQLKYFGGRSLTIQSHGQSLLSFFRARYKIKGLYLVDEPETALSPRSQLELLQLLGETAKSGLAQFIIATHSPLLMASPGATIFSFDHQPVRVLPYEETGHFQLYRRFLLDPAAFLAEPAAPGSSSTKMDGAATKS
jgi:predicted ATPase